MSSLSLLIIIFLQCLSTSYCTISVYSVGTAGGVVAALQTSCVFCENAKSHDR